MRPVLNRWKNMKNKELTTEDLEDKYYGKDGELRDLAHLKGVKCVYEGDTQDIETKKDE